MFLTAAFRKREHNTFLLSISYLCSYSCEMNLGSRIEHYLRETLTQSAEILNSSPDVKYDFGFIRRSGACQSAKGFFKNLHQWVSLFLGVCGLTSFLLWSPEKNLGSMQSRSCLFILIFYYALALYNGKFLSNHRLYFV